MANLIQLTDAQREAVGQVMADNFGANFQTGMAERKDHVYIFWTFYQGGSQHAAVISPDGTVIYG